MELRNMGSYPRSIFFVQLSTPSAIFLGGLSLAKRQQAAPPVLPRSFLTTSEKRRKSRHDHSRPAPLRCCAQSAPKIRDNYFSRTVLPIVIPTWDHQPLTHVNASDFLLDTLKIFHVLV